MKNKGISGTYSYAKHTGVEEAVSHWSGKSFKYGHTCVESRDIYIPTGFREPGVQMYKSYCEKHNQHAKHANARGAWGMPPRKFLKNMCSEIEFGSVSGS